MKQEKIFLDAKHNFVEPSKARWCVVEDYDEKGNLVKETWVDLSNKEVV